MKKCFLFLIAVLFTAFVCVPDVVYALDGNPKISSTDNPDRKKKKKAEDKKEASEVKDDDDDITKGDISITSDDEVSLVVMADAPTKTEATTLALRSAIEQAFGTFVSANTTILNDELVKDEIATISSGNIKGYKILSVSTLPNGNVFVSLQAVVSISKLVSYSKGHGSEAEFSGKTFLMQVKLNEFNRQNELKALRILYDALSPFAKNMYDYHLKIGTPEKKTINTYQASRLIDIALDDRRWTQKQGYDNAEKVLSAKISSSNIYEVPCTIIAAPNDNYRSFTDIILKTFAGVFMPKNDNYENTGEKIKTSFTQVVVHPYFLPQNISDYHDFFEPSDMGGVIRFSYSGRGHGMFTFKCRNNRSLIEKELERIAWLTQYPALFQQWWLRGKYSDSNKDFYFQLDNPMTFFRQEKNEGRIDLLKQSFRYYSMDKNLDRDLGYLDFCTYESSEPESPKDAYFFLGNNLFVASIEGIVSHQDDYNGILLSYRQMSREVKIPVTEEGLLNLEGFEIMIKDREPIIGLNIPEPEGVEAPSIKDKNSNVKHSANFSSNEETKNEISSSNEKSNLSNKRSKQASQTSDKSSNDSTGKKKNTFWGDVLGLGALIGGIWLVLELLAYLE